MDSIASGPTCPDTTTREEALELIHRYGLQIRPEILKKIRLELPLKLNNIDNSVSGSVSELCHAAAKTAIQYGYTPLILTTSLDCEAKEAGRMVASLAREIRTSGCPLPSPCALILGGETVVHLKGRGKGGAKSGNRSERRKGNIRIKRYGCSCHWFGRNGRPYGCSGRAGGRNNRSPFGKNGNRYRTRT